jgi:hypothetical protein
MGDHFSTLECRVNAKGAHFLGMIRPRPVSRLHPGVPLGMRALGARQSGNIRYTVVRQAFKWQQNGNSAATDWQHLWLAWFGLPARRF